VSLDLRPADLDYLRSMLDMHVPGCAVWAFGSRVQGKARPYADLDLVVFAEGLEGERAVARLRDELEESDLPFPIDLLIWSDLPEAFRDIIRDGHIVLQEAADA
jgi:uncharacterized protein